ncbi:hypothetical protein V8F20_008215 [Naviculisporaceae sp. PSN 640]
MASVRLLFWLTAARVRLFGFPQPGLATMPTLNSETTMDDSSQPICAAPGAGTRVRKSSTVDGVGYHSLGSRGPPIMRLSTVSPDSGRRREGRGYIRPAKGSDKRWPMGIGDFFHSFHERQCTWGP